MTLFWKLSQRNTSKTAGGDNHSSAVNIAKKMAGMLIVGDNAEGNQIARHYRS